MRISAGGKTFTFDPNKFLNTELIAVERATGFSAIEFQDGLNRGSMMAATALLWILQKRHVDPTIQFDDVEFDSATLLLEDDPKEPAPDSISQESGETAIPITVPSGTEFSSSVISDSDRGNQTV